MQFFAKLQVFDSNIKLIQNVITTEDFVIPVLHCIAKWYPFYTRTNDDQECKAKENQVYTKKTFQSDSLKILLWLRQRLWTCPCFIFWDPGSLCSNCIHRLLSEKPFNTTRHYLLYFSLSGDGTIFTQCNWYCCNHLNYFSFTSHPAVRPSTKHCPTTKWPRLPLWKSNATIRIKRWLE